MPMTNQFFAALFAKYPAFENIRIIFSALSAPLFSFLPDRVLGQYLSAKSIYGEFLKAPNKKTFRQAHSDELAQYEEALQILKQHSPDGKFPTMKDLRAEKEQLTIQKDAQYDTYHYFKDYHKELKTVCANVDSILGTEQEVQQHEQQRTRKYEQSL